MRRLMITLTSAVVVLLFPSTTADVSALDDIPLPVPIQDPDVLRLEPVAGLDGATGAWLIPGAIYRLHGIAADTAWIKSWEAAAGGRTMPEARGLYRVQPDAVLERVSDIDFSTVDVDGSFWQLEFSSRYVDGRWLRVEKGKSIAVRNGVLWGYQKIDDADACKTELRSAQRAIELRRSSAQGSDRIPCTTLPPLRLYRSGTDPRYAAAGGPDGSLYLASAVADSEDPANKRRYTAGLFRIDGAGWAEITLPDSYVAERYAPDGMWVADNGDIWITWDRDPDTQAFARHDGTSWEIFDVASDDVSGIGVDWNWPETESRFALGPDSRAWLAADTRLILFAGAEPRDALTAEGIQAVSVAGDGTIWVGVGNTLQRFPPTWLLPTEPETPDPSPWPMIAVIAAGAGATVAVLAAVLARRRTARQSPLGA